MREECVCMRSVCVLYAHVEMHGACVTGMCDHTCNVSV